jgi:hypothetical protein
MNSETSLEKKEKTKLFEMILSSPGMTDECKINFRISRQHALMLGRLIETGILSNKKKLEDDILGSIAESSVPAFKEIQEEILKKAGLTEFYEKLKNI